jgi:2-keto-4-pentenoate hydratase/2-oxohepta-3-ene-1,7-dioic acid hydratase in catechol pathway
MKLCRFQPLQFQLDSVRDAANAGVHPEPLGGIIENNFVRQIDGDFSGKWSATKAVFPLDQVKLLPPVEPSKIVCVGRNYREHAAELGNEVPKEPLIFLKPPSSIIGPDEPIVLTPLSQRVDFEGELAVIIGRRCSQLTAAADVAPYILGYTCLNDVTARDLQKADVQFTRAKGFDTFCPVGPVIETDLDLRKAALQTFVNGQRKQSAPLTDMIFPVDVIIRWVSRMMTLLPGDIISTGTPSGVGPLRAGDVVEVVISGVATLRNPVAAPEA